MVLTGIFAVVSSFVAMFQINGEIALWDFGVLADFRNSHLVLPEIQFSYLPKYAGKIKSAEHEIE